MKAAWYNKYGPPEVVSVQDIPKPQIKPNQILVKVVSATLAAGDWRMRSANPFLARLFNGLFRPRRIRVLGFEASGIIEEVGSQVKEWKKGDEVIAGPEVKFGAHAEYMAIKADSMVVRKPSNVSFEEAAPLCVGGTTAIRFMRPVLPLKGKKVLIYGASGSVGSYAVQLAKAEGAEVTAVCSTRNLEMVKELGADRLVDYTKEDFADLTDEFHWIHDAVGKMDKRKARKLLAHGGKLNTVWMSPKSDPRDLQELADHLETGRIKTVIDRTYPLADIVDAHRYVESFRKKGNVIIRVSTPT
jgi:NADPH:quinone reductase-like Zn-dependent oxidoreductase